MKAQMKMHQISTCIYIEITNETLLIMKYNSYLQGCPSAGFAVDTGRYKQKNVVSNIAI